MKPRFKDSALTDLEEARDFYELQEAGMGDYFLHRMEEEYSTLARTAGVHRQRDGFHCHVTRRFHHLIYNRMEAQVPVIYAVLGGRRDPEFNRQKIRRF